jgi:hypothetical protein
MLDLSTQTLPGMQENSAQPSNQNTNSAPDLSVQHVNSPSDTPGREDLTIVFSQQQELSRELILAEFNSLTTERNNRQTIRYQMVQFAVAALAALLTVSSVLQNHLAFLIFTYPFLVLILSVIYMSNAYETRRITGYLKTRIEIFLPVIEQYKDSVSHSEKMGWYRYRSGDKIETAGSVGNVGAKITFIGTALFALVMGFQIMSPNDHINPLIPPLAIGVTVLVALLLVAEGYVYHMACDSQWVERPIGVDHREFKLSQKVRQLIISKMRRPAVESDLREQQPAEIPVLKIK